MPASARTIAPSPATVVVAGVVATATTATANEQWDGDPIPAEGRLDLRSEGYGFLRVNGYIPSRDDAYVPVKLVRQYGLRKGDVIAGPSRPANRNEKNPALMSVESVNGGEPDAATARPDFDDLVPVHPAERLTLEHGDGDDAAARLIDLVAPIGKGQRGLIVAPPARQVDGDEPDRPLVEGQPRRCSPDHLVDRRTSRRGHLDGACPR